MYQCVFAQSYRHVRTYVDKTHHKRDRSRKNYYDNGKTTEHRRIKLSIECNENGETLTLKSLEEK